MNEVFTVSRIFDAPRDLVWDVWTKPEHFAVWFGTEAVRVPLDTVTMDVRAGGDLRAVMHTEDGAVIHWHGKYITVDRPAHIAFTISDDPEVDADEPITVDFEEVSGGTRVTLNQPRGDFSDDQVAATKKGYNDFFDSFDKVLGTVR